MRVRVIKTILDGSEHVYPGKEITMDPRDANVLIETGYVVPVSDTKTEPPEKALPKGTGDKKGN